MSEVADLKAMLDKLVAQNAELSKTVATLARHSGPVITEKRQDEFTRLYEACKAVAELPASERAAAILKMDPPAVKRTLQFLKLEDLAETLEHVPTKGRSRITAQLGDAYQPESLLKEILLIVKTPPVSRVEVRLADESTAVITRPITGFRRSDNYPGMVWVGKNYVGTTVQGGACVRYYTASQWTKLLTIDLDLAKHVENGLFDVRTVSDEQSRSMSIEEVRTSHRRRAERISRGLTRDMPEIAQLGTHIDHMDRDS